MGGDRKHPWEVGDIVAQAFVHHMAPHAERIKVAGSLRRRKDEVGDIEIVMIPKIYREKNLLGEEGPRFDTVQKGIDSYIECETYPGRKPALERLNDGDRHIKLRETIVGIQIDLFVVRPPAEWGPIFSIRTGSADFSRRLMVALRNRGMRCEEGRVLDMHNRLVPCPEEKDFFKAAGVPMIDPVKR